MGFSTLAQAMRKGTTEYKQGTGRLFTESHFGEMEIKVDALGAAFIGLWGLPPDRHQDFDWDKTRLIMNTCFSGREPRVKFLVGSKQYTLMLSVYISVLNDEGYSIEQIARFVEAVGNKDFFPTPKRLLKVRA